MTRPARAPVWITGIGLATPLGDDAPAFFARVLAGESAIGPIRTFDASGLARPFAAELPDLGLESTVPPEDLPRFDLAGLLGLSTARRALHDAGLPTRACGRIGLVVGTTLGGMIQGEITHRAWLGAPPFPGTRNRATTPAHVPYFAPSVQVARACGITGPVQTSSIACASGTHAIGLAATWIREGVVDAAVAGGLDLLSPFVVSGFEAIKATSSARARPFDRARDGLTLGEGAAFLVLESEASARTRGRSPRAVVEGFGLAGDARHLTAPDREGGGAARSMTRALADAGLPPGAIDWISAHGTGTVYNDRMEAMAIRAVFGDRADELPVHSVKGAIGHALGAAGAIEAALAVLVLESRTVPPTAGLTDIDPECRVHVPTEARAARVARVLSTSSAFAGNNAALVLSRGAA